MTERPSGSARFAFDSPLVSTQWLFDHLGAEELVVLDASVLITPRPAGGQSYVSGEEQYLVEGHIPGALFADLIEAFSEPGSPLPFTRPGAERFATAAGALGITPDTAVIVYDSGFGQWASRLWWLFRSFGHDTVAVLDGGLSAWRREERGLDTGYVAPEPAEYAIPEEHEGFWIGKDGVAAIVAGERPGALVCGTSRAEFAGETGGRARGGHIPGSISAPLPAIVDRETNTFQSPARLAEVFSGVGDTRPVVVYCGGGIAAAADALALGLAGVHEVLLYDGSLYEWALDDALPLVTAG